MRSTNGKRILSLFVAFALLVGLLPAVVSATDTPPGEPVYSSMRLQGAFNPDTISFYTMDELGERVNYYVAPATLNDACNSPLEWMLLAFSLTNNQRVTLELWTLKEDFPEADENPVTLTPDFSDGTAQEEFLGERLGVLYGIQLLDNVDAIDTEIDEERTAKLVYKTPADMAEAAKDAAIAYGEEQIELESMKSVYAYGVQGVPYKGPSVSLFSVDDDFYAKDAPQVLPA